MLLRADLVPWPMLGSGRHLQAWDCLTMLCTKILTRVFCRDQSHPCKFTPFQQWLVHIQRWLSREFSITTAHNLG